MLRVFLSLALGLAASCALAQTAPSPADVGISKGTPDVFKLKGHDNAWTPFGSVDPSTHIYVPGTNGNIAPNDCVKWGPGLTSAGAACNSVTGGAHPANQLTIYTNHAGLVANVTTPTEAWTVQQQGFYAPGDGGEATYQWSLTSYCAGGTSGAPVAADGIICVLPIGQSASVGGRYILNTDATINVRQVGMQPGGQDNSPYVQTLMKATSPPGGAGAGPDIVFPQTMGQTSTDYYFSAPFSLSRGSAIYCTSAGMASAFGSKVNLIFAAGVHGVIQEPNTLTPDGGHGAASDIRGCSIYSLGKYATLGGAPHGATTITGLVNDAVPGTLSFSPPYIGVGDGVLIFGRAAPVKGGPLVAPGAYVQSANAGAQTITLASPYVIGQQQFIFGGYADNAVVWDLPLSEAYQVQTTSGHACTGPLDGCSDATAIVTGGKRPLKPGDFIWSDAFVFGAMALQVRNTLVGTPTVNAGGSGYSGASGTMTWSGAGCATAPVLNVTASAGAITGVTSVANVGECDGAWPLSTATTWMAGGGLSGGAGATFNTAFQNTVYFTTFYGYYAPSPSSKTGTRNLWVLPAGIMRRVNSSTHGAMVAQFPFGLEMACDSGSAPALGCNNSMDQYDTFYDNGAGRFTMGNNSGASNSIANVYAFSSIADIIEGGTVKSLYLGDNSNSAEESTSSYGVMGSCGFNDSTFIGMYAASSQFTDGFCLANDANNNPNIGVGTLPGQGSMLAMGSGIPGVPNINSGVFQGLWTFAGVSTEIIVATAATPSGSVIALPMPGSVFRGWPITDLTNSVIPDGTLIADFAPGTNVTITNPLTGGGVQAGDKIQISNPSSGYGACLSITGGMSFLFSIDPACGQRGWLMGIDGHSGSVFLGDSLRFGLGTSYQGYQGGTSVIFQNGLEISNDQGNPYQEIKLDAGSEPQTQTTEIRGNVRLNELAGPGGEMAWVTTAVATTTLSAAVVSGTTTSVAVAACPTITPPVSTPITDTVRYPVAYLGSFASCSGGTLTFQSPASHNGAISDPINFLGVRPAGLIASDAAGQAWLIGSPFQADTPPPCDAGHYGFGTVVFAELVSDKGYGAPVGPTTGPASSVRPAFCDGTSWTYH